MAKGKGGRPERSDDERVVFHGAQAKKENPDLAGFDLAREAFQRAGLLKPERRDLDRLSKKIKRKIERGQAPDVEPAPSSLRRKAAEREVLQRETRRRLPLEIERAEAKVVTLGLSLESDFEAVRSELRRRLGRLREFFADPDDAKLLALEEEGFLGVSGVDQGYSQKSAEKESLEAQLEAVNLLLNLRSGFLAD